MRNSPCPPLVRSAEYLKSHFKLVTCNKFLILAAFGIPIARQVNLEEPPIREPKEKMMIAVEITLDIEKNKETEFLQTAKELLSQIRESGGCRSLFFVKDMEEDDHF